MPPTTTAPERTEAGSSAGAPARSPLMSPGGYAVCAVVVALTAGVVFLATRSFGRPPAPEPRIVEPFVEVPLGRFSRDLPPDEKNLIRDQFMLEVSLRLNPRYKNLEELKQMIDRRRNLLKDVVWREIIYKLSEQEMRNPGILDALGEKFREKLNAELGSSRDGQDVIHKVLFPDSRLPAHR